MPQMVPMNWLLLFFMFVTSLILFAVMNYYIFNYNLPTSATSPSIVNKSLYWKW
uniref:ATP synthase complex subunit 8 n=1 Tax=Atlanticus sinensis TaxID=420841 RepID=A0A7L9QC56_9ORTH|nr:ATP synthase F0 subunit 8 [Atlanticus sinensis]